MWSFGCVCLLTLIFTRDEAQAIEDFSQATLREDPTNHGLFCNVYAPRGDVRNPAVTQHLSAYIERRASFLELDYTIAVESLEYIKKSVLVQYSERHDISQVSTKLRSIYNNRPPVVAVFDSHWYIPKCATHCGHSPDSLPFYYSPNMVDFCDKSVAPGGIVEHFSTDASWSKSVQPNRCPARSVPFASSLSRAIVFAYVPCLCL